MEIATRAVGRAELGGYDAVLMDTAGRLQIDEELMDEVARLQTVLRPHHDAGGRRRDGRSGCGQHRAGIP